jgi:hypothetical protein
MQHDAGDKSNRANVERFTATDDSRGFRVIVEDDGEAAFAYLEDLDATTYAAVWLYNRNRNSPLVIPKSPEDLPSPNRPDAVVDIEFRPIEDGSDVDVYFQGTSRNDWSAMIYIRSRLHAYLRADDRTGWCVLAKINGPYAKRMVAEQLPDGSWKAEID